MDLNEVVAQQQLENFQRMARIRKMCVEMNITKPEAHPFPDEVDVRFYEMCWQEDERIREGSCCT